MLVRLGSYKHMTFRSWVVDKWNYQFRKYPAGTFHSIFHDFVL